MDYKTTSIVQLVRLYNYGIQPRCVYEGLHAVFMYVHRGVYMIGILLCMLIGVYHNLTLIWMQAACMKACLLSCNAAMC